MQPSKEQGHSLSLSLFFIGTQETLVEGSALNTPQAVLHIPEVPMETTVPKQGQNLW